MAPRNSRERSHNGLYNSNNEKSCVMLPKYSTTESQWSVASYVQLQILSTNELVPKKEIVRIIFCTYDIISFICNKDLKGPHKTNKSPVIQWLVQRKFHEKAICSTNNSPQHYRSIVGRSMLPITNSVALPTESQSKFRDVRNTTRKPFVMSLKSAQMELQRRNQFK